MAVFYARKEGEMECLMGRKAERRGGRGGDTIPNSRGVMLAATFADLDLYIFNNGEVTHYHGSYSLCPVLTLSICSPDVYLAFS